MDAEMKKHNERVMQAMEVQAELMLSLQQAVADSTEAIVKAITESMVGIVKVIADVARETSKPFNRLTPVLSQMLINMKFQSWCASEVTKIQNVGATLEVQKAYDQMLVDSGQTFPPGDGFKDPKRAEPATQEDAERWENDEDPKHGETVVMEDSVEVFDGVQALGVKGPTKDLFGLDGEPIDEVLRELSSTKEEVSMDGETVPKDLKALLDAQPKEE